MLVVFLDIDGVLNSRDFFNKDDESWKPVIPYTSENRIDPFAVKLLDDFIQEVGAEVVLSSSWRILYTLEEMNKILTAHGFSKKLLDKTPRIHWDESLGKGPRCENERGNEIDHWLKNHPEVTKFIIFDDDSDMRPHQDKHVKTTWLHGLLPEHIKKARKVLKG
jgi:hypothetical protein